MQSSKRCTRSLTPAQSAWEKSSFPVKTCSIHRASGPALARRKHGGYGHSADPASDQIALSEDTVDPSGQP